MNKTIIFVGGGISGLSGGIHAQLAGYKSIVLEKDPRLGGFCTTWKRGDYIFDGMMHFLYGSKAGTYYNNFWKTLGILDQVQFKPLDSLRGIRTKDGDTFDIWKEPAKFREEMRRYCTNDQDRASVEVVIHDILTCTKDYSEHSLMPGEDTPIEPNYESSKQYFDRLFTNKKLALMATQVFGERPSLKSHLKCIAGFMSGDLLYPDGGSHNFANKVANTLRNLGGETMNNAEVMKVNIDGTKATEVVLKNGDIVKADHIVFSSDITHAYSLIPRDKYRNIKLEKVLEEADIYPSAVLINFGMKSKMLFETSYAFHRIHELHTPVKVCGQLLGMPNLRYLQSESFHPKDESILQLLAYISYDKWVSLKGNKKAYNQHKKDITNQFIEQLELIYPGFKSNIKIVDTATPLTFERYTHNAKGGFMSFAQTDKNVQFANILRDPFVGLSNVHIGSNWRGLYSGLACAAENGKVVVDRIKKMDGI